MQKADITGMLSTTGSYLKQHAASEPCGTKELSDLNGLFFNRIEKLIKEEYIYNPWFTEDFVRYAIGAISDSLNKESVEAWLEAYPTLPLESKDALSIGVVMAGNIPLVGFHDFLSVLVSGHRFLGKTSSKDDRLIKMLAEVMKAIEPQIADRISFTEETLKNTNAIIATGSNNTSRYFEYYFKDIPHVIRKNRNGVAVLTGEETDEELLALGRDIFTYFGLGCRNVTKIFIPESFKAERLMEVFEHFAAYADHNKYANNLQYNRSVYLMNSIPFLDNGVLLLKEEKDIASPVGVVYYEKYSQIQSVLEALRQAKELIQCIISVDEQIEGSIKPGESQSPALWDYADGIDTLKFLASLNHGE